MLILPHNIDLGLARRPYATYVIMALCLIIHYFQAANRDEVSAAALSYCEARHEAPVESSAERPGRSIGECWHMLVTLHSVPDQALVIDRVRTAMEEDGQSRETIDSRIKSLNSHYDAFAARAPRSLDARLEYDPAAPNPIRSITSALSHGDWWHVSGNLIFFFAFAPALEILLGSVLRYIGILVLIAFVTDITYSITSLASGQAIPSLGLSGVVMGVIGLSAFLMPNAKIKTFVWFIFFARNLYLPAWLLALWFIGWDMFDLFARGNNGGVNLVAHVSGGIAGYLIGLLWLKQHREDIREDLDEEIEYRCSLRADRLGILSSNRGGQQRIANEWREHYARQEHSNYVDSLYRMVRAGNDSEAVLLMLDRYELYRGSIEIYEELFREMQGLAHRRSMQCLGRLIISELLNQRKFARAIRVAETCVAASKDFVLADPAEVLVLANMACKQNHRALTLALLADAELKYGAALDLTLYRQLQAQLSASPV